MYPFDKDTSRHIKIEKPSPISKNFLRQSQSVTPQLGPKKQKTTDIWHNHVESQLFATVNQKLISILILYTSSLK